MAAAVGRFYKPRLLQPVNGNIIRQVSKFSTTTTWSKGQKLFVSAIGALAGAAGATFLALDHSVRAELELHPPKLPWFHNQWGRCFDAASLRRGYEVYKQVCSACHSLQYVRYRELIGVTHTEDEARAEAEEIQVRDGPDATGEYFMRPGKLFDAFPKPYPNEEAARTANNGAYPPDLSYIVPASHGEEDYIFHLLTGYVDAPAGVTVGEGQYYNAYFVGGAIGMAQALYNEVIEYSDCTPATASQMAKDVSCFLRWTSEPEHDTKAIWWIKTCFWFPLIFAGLFFINRRTLSTLKTRKVVFTPPAPRRK